MSRPTSGSKNKPSKNPEWSRVASSTDFTLLSCSAYSSILKTDAECSSETSVNFQRATSRYSISEDRTLQFTACLLLYSSVWGVYLSPFKHKHVHFVICVLYSHAFQSAEVSVVMQAMRATWYRALAAFPSAWSCVPARPVTSIHLGTTPLTVCET
jgi:hypothetical protein